jgi:protein TonB
MRALLLLLITLAGLSLSAPTPAATVTKPDWVEKPSASDLSRYYPEAAQRRGMGGRVKMSCTVAIGGTLEDCEVLSEYPAGFGFGAAAIALSRQFRMQPMIRGGQPVESRVVIR